MFNFNSKKRNRKVLDFKIKNFNEELYLEANPDISVAIKKKQFQDALHHLSLFGFYEIQQGKRKFHPDFENFDENLYLKSFPDIQLALQKGDIPSVYEHFSRIGYQEIIQGKRVWKKIRKVDVGPTEDKILVDRNNTFIRESSLFGSEDEKIIAESGLFNMHYYLHSYTDILMSKVNPIKHFCDYGWKEYMNPNAEFNTKYYLDKYEDVASANVNPFMHWLKYGRVENRLINCVEVDRNQQKKINAPSIIFITHEASQTGAPAVLLSLMKWIKRNTAINFSIVIGASGVWNSRFEELAPCFYMDANYKNFRKNLRDFCGNKVQSVYINTIASGFYAEHLSFLNAEFITHVHEMENVFKVFEPNFEAIKSLCHKFIAVSQGSVEAIERRTTDKEIELIFLKPFIDVKIDKATKLQKPIEKKIIFGCGAVEKRKGFDIFCDIGVELLNFGFTNFKMLWIGSAENKEFDPLYEIEKRGLNEYVEWLGTKDYPRDYFEFGDLFLLPSREDPYPLVCMEAAECSMPIVCFDEEAGGMHSFVENDAGVVAPYLEIDKMSRSIIELLSDDDKRKSLGKKACQKVKERHYVDVVAPKILEKLPKIENSNATTELEAYKEIIDKHTIISFDIFDTLITRRVSNPDVVFDIIEYEHTQSETGIMPLFNERMQTAGKVLESYNGLKDDISIDEIYENMSFYKNSEIEKEIEIQMCTPHPLGIQIYNYALEKNKKIYITSDMYLDKDTIQSMLKKCGITKWNQFLLSSNEGKKKDTGKLYKLIISIEKKENILKNEILHIGDNWVGDVEKAKDSGINALRFNPLYEADHKLFHLLESRENELSQIAKIWNSFCIQSTNLWSEKNSLLSNDFYTKLGFELTGPLASMMAMHVKLEAEEVGTKKIVFMARDGRVIKKAFDALYEKEITNHEIESLYLNLSRSTVIPATFERELSSNDIYFLIEGLHRKEKDLKYFLNKSNIDIEDKKVRKIVNKYFKSISRIPSWNDLNTLSNMFQELSEIIYTANEKNREALKRYLEKFDLLTQKNIILVDVGWLLNIQSRLDKFIKNYADTRVIGCYIGSRDRINKSLSHSSLLFDSGDPFIYSKFFEENTTLCEVLFSAPEASAQALVLDENRDVAVAFKQLDTPQPAEFKIAQKIQMGAEDFFEYLSNARNDFFPEQISKDYFFYLFEALVNTKLDIAQATLGHFEVQLGGHHEFLAYESLIKNNTNFEYKLKKKDEYFEPIEFEVEKPIEKKLIVTSAGLDNGSTRYRALNLGKLLQFQGIESVVVHAATNIDKFKKLLDNTDEIIFQRCFDEQGNVKEFYALAKKLHIKTVYEIDDLIFPEYISEIGSVKGGEWNIEEATDVADAYESFLLKCDRAIVSTPLLKEYIESKYKIPSQILRNKVNMTELIEPKERVSKKLKLIYASGTYSHKKDFEIIDEVLYDFLVKYNDSVTLSILGAAQVPEALLSLDNVSNYPLLEYSAMLQFISKHDLMLVPLENDIFNRAKSSVKFVEAGGVGVPVLASKVGEFELAIEDGENGFLASTPLEFKNKLKQMVESPKMLKKLAKNAYRTISEHYTTKHLEEGIIGMIKGSR